MMRVQIRGEMLHVPRAEHILQKSDELKLVKHNDSDVQGELALTENCLYFSHKIEEKISQKTENSQCKVNLHSHHSVEILATRLKQKGESVNKRASQ